MDLLWKCVVIVCINKLASSLIQCLGEIAARRKTMSKKKSKKKKQKKNYSTIEQHARQGKQLIPPFMQIPNLKFNSWVNDRLPELLWAVLLISHLDRERAIAIFRKAIKYWYNASVSSPKDLTHTALGELGSEQLREFLDFLCADPNVKTVLRPLCLLNDLPGKEQWQGAINNEASIEHWDDIALAVGKSLNNQSQEATDCRWVRVYYQIVIGKLKLPSEELVKEIIYYPNFGNMRKVRPSIRALEMGLNMIEEESSQWSKQFWDQCLNDTPCRDWVTSKKGEITKTGTTLEIIKGTKEELIKHCDNTRITTAVDAKHDAVFGIALYCLSILEELLRVGNSTSVVGRLGLRTLVECYITLAYLYKKDDPELWLTYRNYGAGQAKLTFLKLDQMETKPEYVDVETLQILAGEDLWQEFVNINLGHWENSNLRKMSEEAGVKSEYDKYYSWTSGYIHGQWGAVRDTVFQTCSNPLHRLHRIPCEKHNELNDVIADAALLMDKVLESVHKMYPDFLKRVKI
ncbi:MAG: hypothetical protein PWP71_2463 [Clostridia bacterium]|nr:hypothetical protein [Clostridia bacterium]